MSDKSDNEFREQLRALVFEFEKKGVSLQMIIDYVSSLIENRNKKIKLKFIYFQPFNEKLKTFQ